MKDKKGKEGAVKSSKLLTRNNRPDIKVACILDRSSYECYKYECQLEQLRPETWEEQIIRLKPHFLFVESAWQGVNDSWKDKLIKLREKPKSRMWNLIAYCRENKIRTVFWNTVDPVNYDLFIDLSKLFDTVFTIDEHCVEKYKADLNHDRVFVLPFASQPFIHNPINGTSLKKSEVAITGCWNEQIHENPEHLRMLLNAAKPYGIERLDHYKRANNDYKRYKLFLNANIVKDSSTLLARNVFEILGSGTNIISPYSKGVEKMFAPIIPLIYSEEDCRHQINLMLNNPEYSQRLSLLGIREINHKHLYKHRFDDILKKSGVKMKKVSPKGVSIITCTNREHDMDAIFQNYQHQAWKEKELIIILNHDSLKLNKWKKRAELYPNVSVYQIAEEMSLGVCINYAVDKAKHDYIAKFDDDDYYSPNYLTDEMHAFNYTDADIVGKRTYYTHIDSLQALALRCPGRENQFVRLLAGPTLLIRKEVFNKVKWPDKETGSDTVFLRECHAHNFKLYSTDRYNFCKRRLNPTEHTWKISHLEYLQNCSIIAYTTDYKTHVTV